MGSNLSASRLPGLDGLRGIAVVAVVLFHAEAFAYGWVGVDLFFGISGLLITGILLDAKDADAGIGATLKPFYARRALRILPLAWVTVAVVASITGQYRGALWYAGFILNWLPNPPAPRMLAHYWTLAVEEQFYLLWPLVVLMLRPRELMAMCVAIPLLDSIVRLALYTMHPGFATEHFLGNATVTRADPLALGALLAVLLYQQRRVATRYLIATGAASLAVLAGLLFISQRTGRLIGSEYALQPLLIAVAVAVVLQLTIQLAPPWLEARWLAWVGSVSYGLYLLHGVMAPWFRTHVQSIPLRAGALLGASLVVAAISWNVLERPFLAFKRYVTMPGRGREVPSELGAASTALG
jgi:peptidoglycan/LPS O-acetylase OafA/YrhL